MHNGYDYFIAKILLYKHAISHTFFVPKLKYTLNSSPIFTYEESQIKKKNKKNPILFFSPTFPQKLIKWDNIFGAPHKSSFRTRKSAPWRLPMAWRRIKIPVTYQKVAVAMVTLQALRKRSLKRWCSYKSSVISGTVTWVKIFGMIFLYLWFFWNSRLLLNDWDFFFIFWIFLGC